MSGDQQRGPQHHPVHRGRPHGRPGLLRAFPHRSQCRALHPTAKPIIIDGLRLTGTEHVLDLGCGTGEDAVALAQLVKPAGQVVGVDVSETMISEASRRTEGLDLPLTFEIGDAQTLRFADGAFDAVRCERTLMHVVDEEKALAEMVRVTRPGERISVFDFDWDTMVIDSPYRDTTRTIVRGFSDGIRHGWIGRQLRRRLHEHGLVDLSVHPHQVFAHREVAQLLLGGFLTTAQREGLLEASAVEAWWHALEDADATGDFLVCFTAFIVAGRRAD